MRSIVHADWPSSFFPLRQPAQHALELGVCMFGIAPAAALFGTAPHHFTEGGVDVAIGGVLYL
jgi:hypothetical protein